MRTAGYIVPGMLGGKAPLEIFRNNSCKYSLWVTKPFQKNKNKKLEVARSQQRYEWKTRHTVWLRWLI